MGARSGGSVRSSCSVCCSMPVRYKVRQAEAATQQVLRYSRERRRERASSSNGEGGR